MMRNTLLKDWTRDSTPCAWERGIRSRDHRRQRPWSSLEGMEGSQTLPNLRHPRATPRTVTREAVAQTPHSGGRSYGTHTHLQLVMVVVKQPAHASSHPDYSSHRQVGRTERNEKREPSRAGRRQSTGISRPVGDQLSTRTGWLT